MPRFSVPGDSPGDSTLRSAAVPHHHHRQGAHRRIGRGAGKKKWLLVPVAAMAAAALTGGIAAAATGFGGVHFKVTSPVTVQALGVDISNAGLGQTVTAGAKVVAERQTTLSEVALAVKAPDGTRVDFPHATNWTLGTTQKTFIRSKAFNQNGTYTYWFAYKKNGHWTNLEPKQTFTVGSASTTPPTAPGTPSTSPSASPSTSPSSTPTAGPTTSPSASPTGGGSTGGSTSPSANPSQHNCASNPGSCGYPTTATAGVPAGTALTVINGDLTINTNGAVVDGKEIHGCIDVRASNVTIRNTRIIGPCIYGLRTDLAPSAGTTVLDRVEINCGDGHGTGLAGPHFAAHAVYIHNCENGLEINEGSSLSDSVISAIEVTQDAHGDGIQSQDGTNVVIRHNTLLEINPVTSAIITNPTLNNGWLIEDNFMGGGAYTLYCTEKGTGWTVRNNRFVPAKTGALYSAAFGLTSNCAHTGITWTGNYLDSDGSTVVATN